MQRAFQKQQYVQRDRRKRKWISADEVWITLAKPWKVGVCVSSSMMRREAEAGAYPEGPCMPCIPFLEIWTLFYRFGDQPWNLKRLQLDL